MAQFLPIRVQVFSPDLTLPCPPAAKRFCRINEVWFVMYIVRGEDAKIVTSLLIIPSLLGL